MTDVPINMEELENALYTWINESTGLTTIWDNQSAPRPDYPYCSLNIISGPTPHSPSWSEQLTHDPFGDPLEDLIVDLGVPCSFTLSVKAKVNRPAGSSPLTAAKQYLLRALSDLNFSTRKAALEDKDISFYRSEAMPDISEVVNDGFVNIASMDFIMGSVFNAQELLTFIETVHVGMRNEIITSLYESIVDSNDDLIMDGLGISFVIESS